MRLVLLLTFLLMNTPSIASPVTVFHSYKFQQKKFVSNPELPCQVKQFTVFNTHQELKDSVTLGDSHFTSMAAVIDTTTPVCIRDFGVVQYVQGCMTNQELNKNTGEMTAKHYGNFRTSREKDIFFTHPSREIDSLNMDPLYASKASTDSGERMGWYYVSKTPIRLVNNRSDVIANDQLFQSPKSRTFLENTSKPTQQTYVTDFPLQADYHSDPRYPTATITSPSLDFKTCLYEVKDIPIIGSPASPETPHSAGGPLVCFSWSHKFDFDPKTRNFNERKDAGTDPFCQSPTPILNAKN